MSEIYIGDPSFKYPILISSIPTPTDTYSLTTGTLGANTQLTIVWTTTPSRSQLSLWNFRWAVRFGSNTDNHKWPEGSSLTGNQASVRINFYSDALQSDDGRNIIVNKIIMANPSGDSFSYWQYFKAYTFATSVGVSAA